MHNTDPPHGNDDKKELSYHITSNIKEIINNFRLGLGKRGYMYDEDIFNDSIIKCLDIDPSRTFTKKEAISFLWTVYLNRYKSVYQKQKRIVLVDEYDDNVIDTKYDIEKDILYKNIIDKVKKRFGEKIGEVWRMYTSREKKFNEIVKEHPDLPKNLKYELRKITNYVKSHINEFE